MCIYKAHTATMFDMYCRSQFSYTVHLITVTERSPYSERRFHQNIKALLDKWSQSTVQIICWWITHDQGREGSPLLMVSNCYVEHQMYPIAHVLLLFTAHFVSCACFKVTIQEPYVHICSNIQQQYIYTVYMVTWEINLMKRGVSFEDVNTGSVKLP